MYIIGLVFMVSVSVALKVIQSKENSFSSLSTTHFLCLKTLLLFFFNFLDSLFFVSSVWSMPLAPSTYPLRVWLLCPPCQKREAKFAMASFQRSYSSFCILKLESLVSLFLPNSKSVYSPLKTVFKVMLK